MLAYTYMEQGGFELIEKPKLGLKDSRDTIVRVTLSSICTSDLCIKHGSALRVVPGITVGHEMVGVVEQVGAEVTSVKFGDRITVNVETFYAGILRLIEKGEIDTTSLITHRFPLDRIEEATAFLRTKRMEL